MTVSAKINGVDVDVVDGTYQNLEEPVRFAKYGEGLPDAKKLMFESAETLALLKGFLHDTYGSQVLPELVRQSDGTWTLPSGYVIAGIKWCGRGVIFAVPEDRARPGGGSGSCSCTNGTCSYHWQWIPGFGTAYWCEGDCSGTCTLTVSKMGGKGGTLNVFTTYKY